MGNAGEDIGYLKAKAQNTENQIKTLYEKNDHQTVLLGELKTLLVKHTEQAEARYISIEEDLDECKAICEDYKKVKNRGIGIITTISLFMGYIASHLQDLFKF